MAAVSVERSISVGLVSRKRKETKRKRKKRKEKKNCKDVQNLPRGEQKDGIHGKFKATKTNTQLGKKMLLFF